MRNPIALETYYERSEPELKKQLENLFVDHKKGPGAKPAFRIEGESLNIENPVKAVIVPHAPFNLAGPAMAWSYKVLAEEKQDSDLYIIIGQSQTGAQAGTTLETFQTPLGQVRVDQDVVKNLLEAGNIELNDELHAKESLIELQLPFLQFSNGIHKDKLKIVPLLLNADTNMGALALDLKEALIDQNKTATLIFVSNLTSYGRDFHYVPFTENVVENIEKIDKKFIEAIKNLDKDAFELATKETQQHLSGYFALQFMFSYFSSGDVSLEQNYLSGDVNDNYKNTVSYASFVLK